MGTTPTRGFPFPEGTDYVASGDDAIEALALAVDTALHNRMYCDGSIGAATAVAADQDWAIQFGGTGGTGFTATGGGSPYFTYTGPNQRWFLVTVACRVTAAGSGGIGLYLTQSGTVAALATSGDDDPHLSITMPLHIPPGGTIAAHVHIYGAAGEYSGAYLRAVEM